VETWYDDKPCLAFVPRALPHDLAMDKELLLTLSEADRALGELAGLGRTLANPQLLIGPFMRREAVLSSKIEGTQTGIAELYAYEAGQLSLPGIDTAPAQEDAREVLNYVRALQYGLRGRESTTINLELIRNLHSHLMSGKARGKRIRAGEFRTEQNWIGGASIRSAKFVPPPVPQMRDALADLERYLQTPHDYPPLVRLAITHYQFEAIHPFEDGNGRTGRLLLLVILMRWGLLSQPLLYLSAFFEKHRETYFALLLAVSEEGKLGNWVTFFLEGITSQAQDAITRAKRLQDLQIDWHKRLTDRRVSSTLIRLADSVFDMPYLTIPDAQRLLGTSSYKTAQRNVVKLIECGILHQFEGRDYGRLFVAQEILDIVEIKF
jgi:Fic family protein